MMDVTITPINSAPGIRRAIKAAEKNNPKRDSNTSGLPRLPNVNKVSDAAGAPCPSALTISFNVPGCRDKAIVMRPDSFKPIIQINKPIPTVIAIFKELGIASIMS